MNKLSAYSDIELVRMLKKSKPEAEAAFTEIYNRYSGKIHAYCLRIIGEEDMAADVFQDTFIKFYENVKTDYPSTNIHGFLITIARNLCLNKKREKRSTVPVEEIENLFSASQSYESEELLNLIASSLELLEYDYKEAFVLREYEGMSYNEISSLTGISLANAKSRVFRAKQKLKDILYPYLKDLTK